MASAACVWSAATAAVRPAAFCLSRSSATLLARCPLCVAPALASRSRSNAWRRFSSACRPALDFLLLALALLGLGAQGFLLLLLESLGEHVQVVDQRGGRRIGVRGLAGRPGDGDGLGVVGSAAGASPASACSCAGRSPCRRRAGSACRATWRARGRGSRRRPAGTCASSCVTGGMRLAGDAVQEREHGGVARALERRAAAPASRRAPRRARRCPSAGRAAGR